MTFPEMVRSMTGEFRRSASKRAGAMMQLAGLVRGLSSSIDSEVGKVIGEFGKAKSRVYMPKAKSAVKKAKAPKAKDEELVMMGKLVDAQLAAKKEQADVVMKLSRLEAYVKATDEEKDILVSQALSARRAKRESAAERRAKQRAAAKEHEESVRAEFKAKFDRPEVIGKTERFEAYVTELREAIAKEREAYEAAGIAQGRTDLVKELERAMKTGKVQKEAASAKESRLLRKLSGSTAEVGRSIKDLHDDLSVQLLGPFSWMYTTTKGFLTTTLKHFTLDKIRRREGETMKQWLMEKLDRHKLLAEMAHLRKDQKAIPATLRLQMMLSSVMNVLMSAASAAMTGLKYLTAAAIGAAVANAVLDWFANLGKKGQQEDVKKEQERLQQGLEAGTLSPEDKQRAVLWKEARKVFGELPAKEQRSPAQQRKFEEAAAFDKMMQERSVYPAPDLASKLPWTMSKSDPLIRSFEERMAPVMTQWQSGITGITDSMKAEAVLRSNAARRARGMGTNVSVSGATPGAPRVHPHIADSQRVLTPSGEF